MDGFERLGADTVASGESPGGPGSFDVEELQIAASRSVAYCHGLIRIVDSRVRITIGLRKEKGRWLIAHEHHSYPIELE